MNQTEQDYLDQCEQAFLLFCERYPDYPQTDANARQMATELRAANLSPTNAEYLAVVWQKIRPAVVQVSPAPVAEPSDPPSGPNQTNGRPLIMSSRAFGPRIPMKMGQS